MKTNKAAIDLICKDISELKSEPEIKSGYLYPIIGYGHYAADSLGIYNQALEDHGEFTKDDARKLLKDDLVRFETIVERDCKHLKLNVDQFSALVVYTYINGRGALLSLIRGKTKKAICDMLTGKVKTIYKKGDKNE